MGSPPARGQNERARLVRALLRCLALTALNGTLALDFGPKRSDFVLAEYPDKIMNDFIASDNDRCHYQSNVPAAAAVEILQREFSLKVATSDIK